MSTTAAAPAGAEAPDEETGPAGDEGRMWRKVVAFRRDQEEALKELAQGDEGNVSALIREAVDMLVAQRLPRAQAAAQ